MPFCIFLLPLRSVYKRNKIEWRIHLIFKQLEPMHINMEQ